MAGSKAYRENLLQSLKDPKQAAAYLDATLGEGDKEAFLLALRNVTDARLGGIGKLSGITGLNCENLYRTLSEKAKPEYSSLDKLLHALGLRLSVDTVQDNHISS